MTPKFSLPAFFILFFTLLFTACSTYNSATYRIAQHITPYRITVVQGNFVSREAAEKLQVGMSREQVKEILGTPLLTDLFHKNRWDYIFYFNRGSKEIVKRRHFIVYFDDDLVTRWAGRENLPSEYELIDAIDGDKSVDTRGKQKEQKAAQTVTP